MIELGYLAASIAVMAGVTYALRAAPLVALRHQITNRWLRSFLHHVPVAVLTAMTVPAIFFATSSWVSGLIGLVVAVAVALQGRSLIVVAMLAASAVWVAELVLRLT